MLARDTIPKDYIAWNRHWGAPFGSPWRWLIPRALRWQNNTAKLCGYFAFQPNNDTRVFEYPWVFNQLNPKPGLQYLEIGGGVSGMQFLLDHLGCGVTNIDPGQRAKGKGWLVTEQKIAWLNRYFGTEVELKNCFIEQAGLKNGQYDCIYSVSAIEHIPDTDILSILRHAHRALKPDGLFIVTLDLFLDIEPFTPVQTNRYGTNVSVKWLIEQSGLKLVYGKPAELYGFAEFDWVGILGHRDQYLVGSGYPAMVQTIVLQK